MCENANYFEGINQIAKINQKKQKTKDELVNEYFNNSQNLKDYLSQELITSINHFIQEINSFEQQIFIKRSSISCVKQNLKEKLVLNAISDIQNEIQNKQKLAQKIQKELNNQKEKVLHILDQQYTEEDKSRIILRPLISDFTPFKNQNCVGVIKNLFGLKNRNLNSAYANYKVEEEEEEVKNIDKVQCLKNSEVKIGNHLIDKLVESIKDYGQNFTQLECPNNNNLFCYYENVQINYDTIKLNKKIHQYLEECFQTLQTNYKITFKENWNSSNIKYLIDLILQCIEKQPQNIPRDQLQFLLLTRFPLQISTIQQSNYHPLIDGQFRNLLQNQMPDSSYELKEVKNLISFGWFEEILEMRKKQPLYVIGIFGRQSVGKSSLLNRLFGRIFGVSVSRCTDGIWLGYSIIENTQIMAQDCEGLFSTKRTTGEEIKLLQQITFISDISIIFIGLQAIDKQFQEILSHLIVNNIENSIQQQAIRLIIENSNFKKEENTKIQVMDQIKKQINSSIQQFNCESHKRPHVLLHLDEQNDSLFKCLKCLALGSYQNTILIDELLESEFKTIFKNWPNLNELNEFIYKNLDRVSKRQGQLHENIDKVNQFFYEFKTQVIKTLEEKEKEILKNLQEIEESYNLPLLKYNELSQKEKLKNILQNQDISKQIEDIKNIIKQNAINCQLNSEILLNLLTQANQFNFDMTMYQKIKEDTLQLISKLDDKDLFKIPKVEISDLNQIEKLTNQQISKISLNCNQIDINYESFKSLERNLSTVSNLAVCLTKVDLCQGNDKLLQNLLENCNNAAQMNLSLQFDKFSIKSNEVFAKIVQMSHNITQLTLDLR
ncbi:hypothetical protein ABPG72_019012 [Tetrahymena utriculariae]